MFSPNEPHECFFDTVCRTCLGKDNLVSIFSEKNDFQPLRLSEILLECTSIEVSEGDHMPMKMCDTCIEQLSKSFAFKQKCLQSDLMLKSVSCENFEQTEIIFDTEPVFIKYENTYDELGEECTIIIENQNEFDDSVENTDTNYLSDNVDYELIKEKESSDKYSEEAESYKPPVKIQFEREGSTNTEYDQELFIKEECESSDEQFTLQLNEYVCDDCNIEFESVNDYVNHKKNKHGTKYLCNVCGKVFSRPGKLKRHLETHLDPNSNKCIKCDEMFLTENDYKDHMREKHRPECNLCGKLFMSKFHLQKHIIKFHKDNQELVYCCQVCSASFDCLSKLRNHLLVHNDNKSRICDLCGLKISLNNVQRHRQTHTGLKRHECDLCGMKFIQRPTLTEHRAKHAGDTPYTCVRCRQSFESSDELRTHMENHPGRNKTAEFYNRDKSNNKILTCKFCPKEYKSYLGLQHHVRAYHTLERPFLCSICGKSFTQDCQLKAHTLTHTGEKPHVCNLCSRRFTQRAHLVSHMLLHTGEKPYECKYCFKRFRHLTTLRDHTKIHTGDPNKRKRVKNPKPKITEN